MTDRNKIVIEEAISKGHTIEFGTGEKFCISMFRVGQNGPEYLTYNLLPDVVRESMMEGLRKADANSQEPFDEARARAGEEILFKFHYNSQRGYILPCKFIDCDDNNVCIKDGSVIRLIPRPQVFMTPPKKVKLWIGVEPHQDEYGHYKTSSGYPTEEYAREACSEYWKIIPIEI